MRPCHSYQNVDLVIFIVTFDLHILKFNICHNFSTITGSTFIFYMYTPCDEAFLLIPNRLTLWPWPLTFIPENAIYAITGSTFIFHMHIPCYEAFPFIPKLVTLTMIFDFHTQKFNICQNFWTIRGRAFLFHMYIPCDEAFPFILKLLTL